jgi:hypothetical protein
MYKLTVFEIFEKQAITLSPGFGQETTRSDLTEGKRPATINPE